MRSPQKATIIFVAILLLSLLSFVSAELHKRDPQAPDVPPAKEPPAGDAPPAKEPPAGDAPPAKEPPAGNAPPAGGKAGDPPTGGAPAAPGGNPPGGNPPGGNPPGGNPPGGNPPGGNPPGGNPPGGNPPGGNPKNSTAPKYVDPLTPTVQVKMLEPKTTKNLLYKIGSKIKFRWEYSDNFANPPQYINVAAVPQVNPKSNYTIAQNMSLNTIQEVIWDTSTVPSLPMSEYKLYICDENGINAPAKPGGLQVFSSLTFGLYTSQDPGNFCGEGCANNAISIQIISSLSTIGLALITIISFSFILI